MAEFPKRSSQEVNRPEVNLLSTFKIVLGIWTRIMRFKVAIGVFLEVA